MFNTIFVYIVSLLGISSAAMAANPGDVRLFNKPKVVEAAPSVAINPKDTSRMIVAAVTSEGCKYRTSRNGGKAWSVPRALPVTGPADNCRDVKVAYAPDGTRIYATFLYKDNYKDLFFTVSRNESQSWSNPRIIFQYFNTNYGGGISSIQRITTPLDSNNSKFIYITVVTGDLDDEIRLIRSRNFGASWQNMDSIYIVFQREGPEFGYPTFAAGPRGEIALSAICWGCIQNPGYRTSVLVKYSRDYGSSFSTVNILDDDAIGVDEQLPTLSYGAQGVMHIVYAAVPLAGKELRYTWSKAPYKTWASPEFVASAEPNARSFSLQASNCGTATTLHLAWAAQRPISTRTLYDIVSSQRAASVGGHWSAPSRISNAPSKTSTSIVALAAEKSLAFAAWEDRRDGNMSDLDVFGSIVPTGLHCR